MVTTAIGASMRGMVLDASRAPLRLASLAVPTPAPHEVLIRVHACAVCRTDLHVVDGDLAKPKLPLIPGHEIVGRVAALGRNVDRFAVGDRVGVPWLGWTCGECSFCRSGRENLCAQARFTGYHIDGGYGEFTIADQRFCFAIPAGYSDIDAAPLLCAGLIGYRSLKLAGDARRLGLYGFGAAAHIIAQVARWQGRDVYAFTSPGDTKAQTFAHDLGAVWAGGSDQAPPKMLDAAIIFAPVGPLVPAALRTVERGGTVVCAGIHMSPHTELSRTTFSGVSARCARWRTSLVATARSFSYWRPKIPVKTRPYPYALEQANQALDDLRAGRLQGAAVLTVVHE